MSSNESEFDVETLPRKELVVNILTQDVAVMETLQEFVDNSIDGALRVGSREDILDYEVRLELGPDEIVIRDNCGGIPRERAQQYVFRFGPPGEAMWDSQIGEFGVGMKRSLFKLANKFRVESRYGDESPYVIEVDVDEWIDAPEDDWSFGGRDISEEDFNLDGTGTQITILEVKDEIRSEFEDATFIGEIQDTLTDDFRQYIRDGFDIYVNGSNLRYKSIQLYQKDNVIPGRDKFTVESEGSEVSVDIIAGVADREADESGWYVFCNGRSILSADQTSETGWGKGIPNFHPEYHRFRGVVSFESPDTEPLPWNTTKTGLDTDSRIYKKAVQRMNSVSRPIINLFNAISTQKRILDKAMGENVPLEDIIEDGELRDIFELRSELAEDQRFEFPEPKSKEELLEMQEEEEQEEEEQEPDPAHISYTRKPDRVQKVKEDLDVGTNKQAGIETFEFFYELRIDEDG